MAHAAYKDPCVRAGPRTADRRPTPGADLTQTAPTSFPRSGRFGSSLVAVDVRPCVGRSASDRLATSSREEGDGRLLLLPTRIAPLGRAVRTSCLRRASRRSLGDLLNSSFKAYSSRASIIATPVNAKEWVARVLVIKLYMKIYFLSFTESAIHQSDYFSGY